MNRIVQTSISPLEARESASPVITRAVAAALADRDFDVFEFSTLEKALSELLSLFPTRLVSRLVQGYSSLAALDPRLAGDLTTDDLVQQRLADYQALEGSFDHVVMGAALGGATAHLAAALRAPFLPQPFVLGFRGGSPDDETETHLRRAKVLAEAVLGRNPELLAVSHFDPVHDGWITRVINHLRLKLLDLPRGYKDFLRARLNRAGTILYLDCGAPWLQYRLGSRHVYQIGGWGGISPQEFLQGSPRLDVYLGERASPHRGGWALSGLEPEWRPESEWGSEPGLDEALEKFAGQEGYCFRRLRLPHPHDFSRLAFRAYQELWRRSGIEPQGVLIETFTQYDPTSVMRAGLLPVWLIFNTTDSLAFLKQCLPQFPVDKPVYFSGLITFSRTPDMVPWDGWAEALEGCVLENIGARPHRYPEDLTRLWRWVQPLRKLESRISVRAPNALTAEDLLALAAGLVDAG